MNSSTLNAHDLGKSLQNFRTFDYVVFALMLVGCAGIGLYYGLRGKKNMDAEIEYLMGGRNMKVFPIAMSLVASFISGITLLGNPTEAYIHGTQYFFIIFTLLVISYPASYMFLPVFHDMKLASTYEYLERRFDRKLRYFGSVLFTISMICWLPIVIYVPALAFNQVTGMNIHIITPCVCLICIFYTALGGLKAVVWTDVIQSLIMVGAIILVVFKGTMDIGGFGVVWERSWESGRIELPRLHFDFTDRHTAWSLIVGGGVFWLQAAILNQNMIQRYLALPTMTEVRSALWMFTLGTMFIIVLCGFSGLVVYSTYYDCDPLTTKLAKAKDQLLPLLVMRVLGDFPGMPGVFVAGIFSAALSSLSTGLNSMSAIVLEDFVKPSMSRSLSNKQTEIIIKLVVLIFGVICVALVFIVEKLGTVLQLSMSLGAMTGGPLFGIFCLGILYPWANGKGAFYGGIAGIMFSAFVILGAQRAQATGNLIYIGKPLSVEGCDYLFNSTLNLKNSTFVDDHKEIFPLFKVGYLWYPVIGGLITVLFGIVISFFTGQTDLSTLDHQLVSPVIRRYLPGKSVLEKKAGEIPESIRMLENELFVVVIQFMQKFGKNVDVLAEGLKAGISGLMNLATQSSDSASGGYFVNFNQDCTSLTVGTRTGYKLFSLHSVDFLEQIYENEAEDICIVERLFSSSLIAVVSLSSPRKLQVCHFRKGTEICKYSYSNTILAVKLNRVRLVVCLEESLYIHNMRDMKVLHTIRDTPPNPTGLVTLSNSAENCFLAYPGSNTIGEVQIFDANNLHAKIMIPAHDSPLAALAFSPSGKELATASEKGTVIRVFSVQEGAKLYEFRRGVKRCVSISSLVFSTDSSYLCCSSNTETVHVFKLEEPKEAIRPANDDNQGWIGYLTKAVTASANYLPTQVTDVFNQDRAFATVHLPFQGIRNVCAITKIKKVLRLLVAAADGFLYVYNLDSNEGGDCTLVKQHRLGARESTTPSGDQVDGKMPSTAEKIQTAGSISSYAGIVKGRALGTMSDSEKFREMAAASESPPKEGFRFLDDDEFPPVTQKTE